MDVRSYLQSRKQDLSKEAGKVRDFTVFEFSYIPPQPVMREEAKALIDTLLRYDQTGIPKTWPCLAAGEVGKP